MANKLAKAPVAVGYWGGNPSRLVHARQVPQAIRVLLQDKLIALGKPAWLYLPITAGVACTCEKETAKASEYKCRSCWGTRFIPGYKRFMHEELFFASAEYATWTLTGCRIDTRYKPHRIFMEDGATSATIETPDKVVTNPASDPQPWTYRAEDYVRAAGSSINYEFSSDGGNTWYVISAINGPGRPTSATGTLRVRVTLTRTAAADKSPVFEIVRFRRVKAEHANPVIVAARRHDGSYMAGQILIARTWTIEQTLRAKSRGSTVEYSADKAWTAPLDWFDISLVPDTTDCMVRDREPGPHPFYEKTYGVNAGERYILYQESYNEELGIFTHQAFFDRRAQAGEMYSETF